MNRENADSDHGLILLFGMFVVFSMIASIWFWNHSKVAVAEIDSITAHNSMCGRYNQHACTKFNADIKYQVGQNLFRNNIDVGQVDGHDASVTQAEFALREKIEIRYDAKAPLYVSRNSTFGVFKWPIIGVVATAYMFTVVSFKRKRRRRM